MKYDQLIEQLLSDYEQDNKCLDAKVLEGVEKWMKKSIKGATNVAALPIGASNVASVGKRVGKRMKKAIKGATNVAALPIGASNVASEVARGIRKFTRTHGISNNRKNKEGNNREYPSMDSGTIHRRPTMQPREVKTTRQLTYNEPKQLTYNEPKQLMYKDPADFELLPPVNKKTTKRLTYKEPKQLPYNKPKQLQLPYNK